MRAAPAVLISPPLLQEQAHRPGAGGGGVRFSDTGRQPDALQQQQSVFYAGRPTCRTFIQLCTFYPSLEVLYRFFTSHLWLPFRGAFAAGVVCCTANPKPPSSKMGAAA